MDASFITSSQASNIGATSMMDQSSSRISEPGFIDPNRVTAYQRMEQKTSIERTSGNGGRPSNLPFAADLPIEQKTWTGRTSVNGGELSKAPFGEKENSIQASSGFASDTDIYGLSGDEDQDQQLFSFTNYHLSNSPISNFSMTIQTASPPPTQFVCYPDIPTDDGSTASFQTPGASEDPYPSIFIVYTNSIRHFI